MKTQVHKINNRPGFVSTLFEYDSSVHRSAVVVIQYVHLWTEQVVFSDSKLVLMSVCSVTIPTTLVGEQD